MLTLLEQLDKGVLWPTHGGIHPPEMKFISNGTSITSIPLADNYLVPLPQVGESAILTANVGDKVLKGQMLTSGIGRQYCPVHAPTSGTVIAIEPRPSNHASGIAVNTCVIQADGQDQWINTFTADNKIAPESLSNEQIIEKVQHAGVVGMGGAEFPAHIKLSPTSDIELLIINGAECEPYLTSDDRLMREYSDKILAGTEIIHRLLKPKRVVVAIEDNKPEAIKAMEKALAKSSLPRGQARVTVIPTKYPSGSAKQLIKIITGQEVASGGRSSQLGVLVHNVSTAMAIYQAVTQNKPSIERVVSVTGKNVTKPGNYWVPIGTPISHLLKHCGFNTKAGQSVIVGGPMMGYTLPLINVPVLKGTTALIAPSSQEMDTTPQERACIRCGECAQACPASLLPQQLFWHAKAEEYDKAASYNLRDCIECGCCSYVCPSDIPLVEYYRIAKSAIKQAADEKVQAELAKQRFEARLKRLEQEKMAREEKAKQASAKRQTSMQSDEKNAVAAALARIQAKKAAEQALKATDNTDTQTKPNTSNTASSINSDDPKAKIAAAIARAKAKKAAASTSNQASAETQTDAGPVEGKKDKIAAAIARAKAKKAALKTQTDNKRPVDIKIAETNAADGDNANNIPTKAKTVEEINPAPADDKKAKIAAAVARAKAKKAALKTETDNKLSTNTNNITAHDNNVTANANNISAEVKTVAKDNPTSADDKKAKIAAAVAKAKAKKAAAANKQSKE